MLTVKSNSLRMSFDCSSDLLAFQVGLECYLNKQANFLLLERQSNPDEDRDFYMI